MPSLDTMMSYHRLKRAPLDDSMTFSSLIDLMDYCEKEKLKVLFVITLQGEDCADKAGKQNTTVSVLRSRGFDVIDLRRYVDEIRIDPKTDFYNQQHMNINGALKVTRYLSEYLINNYGFSDKRGDIRYQDWTDAAEEYKNLLTGGKNN